MKQVQVWKHPRGAKITIEFEDWNFDAIALGGALGQGEWKCSFTQVLGDGVREAGLTDESGAYLQNAAYARIRAACDHYKSERDCADNALKTVAKALKTVAKERMELREENAKLNDAVRTLGTTIHRLIRDGTPWETKIKPIASGIGYEIILKDGRMISRATFDGNNWNEYDTDNVYSDSFRHENVRGWRMIFRRQDTADLVAKHNADVVKKIEELLKPHG